MSGWGPRRGGEDPVPLARSIDDVRTELGLPASDAYAALQSSWPDMVGDEVAEHARLAGLRSGVLLVTVDHPAWATQLRYLEDLIVERAREILGAHAVISLRWRVDP